MGCRLLVLGQQRERSNVDAVLVKQADVRPGQAEPRERMLQSCWRCQLRYASQELPAVTELKVDAAPCPAPEVDI